ncbi:MAG: ATP-binding protein [Anaerolineae bacterium]
MAEMVIRRSEQAEGRQRFLSSLRARTILFLLLSALVIAVVGALALTLVIFNLQLDRAGDWARTALILFAVLFVIAAAVTLVVGYIVTTPVARRLRTLLRVAETVAEGDLSQRTGFVADDEIGTLGRCFDVMVGRLHERSRQLDLAVRTHDEELARLDALLASMVDGVVMLDRRARIVMFNRAAFQMLGSEDGFWRSDFSQLVVDLDASKPLRTQLAARKRVQIDTEGGRVLEAEAAAVATLAGEELGTVVVIRDVTREALATRLKDQLITQVSHELRTPLTAIKGASDVLSETFPPETPGYNFFGTINRNVLLLDGMICDLLDISEMLVGAFSVRKEPLSVQPLLWETLDMYKPRFRAAGLELQTYMLDPNLRVLGDARRLRWALGHLLDNAIKYTLRGGSVTVTLGELIYGHAVIDIADTGVGIAPDDLAHIFEPYYRGEPVTPEGRRLDPRGLGLGLFIARTVAEAHGGTLTAVSEPGRGSTFSVVLPTAPE